MKYIGSILITIMITFLLVGCGSSGNAEDISTTELETMLSEDYQFLDIRTEEEYKDGHIEEFNLNIDYYQFKDDYSMLDDLDKEKPIVIICRSGNRSGQATKIFDDLGFTEVYNVKGGVSSWNGNLVK